MNKGKVAVVILATLLLPSLLFSSAAVSGTVSSPSGTFPAAGANFVLFELQGCGNNPARPTQPAEASQLTLSARFPINSSTGAISGTIIRNDQISCGGQTTSTFYQVTTYINNSPVAGSAQKYRIIGSTFNLNNATPITVNPVVVAPTGDSTYCRIDAGNCGFTTNPTFASSTGSGAVVEANSPTLITPTLGAAAATSIAINGATPISAQSGTGGTVAMTGSPTIAAPVLTGITQAAVIGVGQASPIGQLANTTTNFPDSNGVGSLGAGPSGGFVWQGTAAGYTAEIANSGAGANANALMARVGNAPGGAAQRILTLATGTADVFAVTNNGFLANGTAFKHVRTATCTTGNVALNNCNTTVNWPGTGFADTNYTVNCTLYNLNAIGHISHYGTKLAGSILVALVTDTAVAITGTIDCIAVHDP